MKVFVWGQPLDAVDLIIDPIWTVGRHATIMHWDDPCTRPGRVIALYDSDFGPITIA